MKLILTQEVTGLGGAGDIVEVKDGYGRNYLVPRGVALRWTRGAERQVADLRRARESREVRDLGHAQELREQLEGLTVRLPVKAGNAGRLFGSVTPADIAGAIQAAAGPSVDRRRIDIRTPIKSVGRQEVVVRLHPEVAATVTVEVVAG